MFDHKLVSSSRVGTFTLVSDVETNDFAVTVERAECDSAVCLTSITIHDQVGNHVLRLFNNGKVCEVYKLLLVFIILQACFKFSRLKLMEKIMN